jgi:hypothetical protein
MILPQQRGIFFKQVALGGNMRRLETRIIISITTFILLTAIGFELNAAPVELSVTILESATQKVVSSAPIHTTDPIHYGITARNSGTAGINVPIDIFFPQQILPSGGSGTGFSCSLTSRTTLHCITTSLLLANSSRTISVAAQAPATITGDSQTFTIKAKIDPANAVAETNEGDNEDTVVTTVVPRGPDLTVDLTGSDRTASGGGEVKYVVHLKNIGDRPSSESTFDSTLPSVVTFSRIENSQFSTCFPGGDNVSCTIGHDKTLAAGASSSVTVVGVVDKNVENSVVTFNARTESSISPTTDTNANNNSSSVSTTLTELADLIVTSNTFLSYSCGDFSIVSPLKPGTTYDVLKAKVKNNGHTNAPASKVRVTIFNGGGAMIDCGSHKQCVDCHTIISSVCTPTGGGTAICDIGPLAPGGLQDLSLTIARATDSTYQAEFAADSDHVVTESSETNNVSTQSVR